MRIYLQTVLNRLRQKSRLLATLVFFVVIVVCFARTSYEWSTVHVHMHRESFNPSYYRSGRGAPWENETVHLAVVMCGERFQEGVVSLKSAIIFTPQNLHIHAFLDPEKHSTLEKTLSAWQALRPGGFQFTLYGQAYPPGIGNQTEWQAVFRPCATLRLFLPSILPLDSVIYVDSDTLVLEDLRRLWLQFKNFTPSEVLSVNLDMGDTIDIMENRTVNRTDSNNGPNTGVLLMNLTRMRQSSWITDVVYLYRTYKEHITLGDQDIVAIYYSLHPERIRPLPCNWNYCSDFCEFGRQTCGEANKTGISLLHGNRLLFHIAYRNIAYFKEAYSIINEKFQLSSGEMNAARGTLLLKRKLLRLTKFVCGSIKGLLRGEDYQF